MITFKTEVANERGKIENSNIVHVLDAATEAHLVDDLRDCSTIVDRGEVSLRRAAQDADGTSLHLSGEQQVPVVCEL